MSASNSALQSLGVRAAGRDDEFDTVGLGRFRRTESWAAAECIRRLVAETRDLRGAAADDAISALLPQATGSQGEVAIWLEAACALAKIGGKAIPALAALLVPGALPNRWHIVRALGEAGPPASMAVPELMNVLKADDDDRVRTEAASTLGKIGGDARSAVPVLIDALRDPSVVIRREAVWALGEIRSGETAVIDALDETLPDSDQYVRGLSAEALRKFSTRNQPRDGWLEALGTSVKFHLPGKGKSQ